MDLSTLPIFCSQCILWSCATKFVWLQCSGFKATRTDNTSWPVQKTETTMDHQLPFWCNLKGTISCPNKLIKPQFVFLPGVTNKSKCFLSNLFFFACSIFVCLFHKCDTKDLYRPNKLLNSNQIFFSSKITHSLEILYKTKMCRKYSAVESEILKIYNFCRDKQSVVDQNYLFMYSVSNQAVTLSPKTMELDHPLWNSCLNWSQPL